MTTSRSAAKTVAEELAEDGQYVITESDARSKIKQTGLESPWKDKIENGFEDQGWTVDEGVYYEPDGFSEKVREFSEKLRAENRPVVSRAVVGAQVTGAGRPMGKWGDQIDEVMRNEGWEIDEENGLYYLPATELVTESSLSYYLLDGFALRD